MTHREEMAEIHGDEFVENFDEAFEIQRRPSVREIILNFVLTNKVALFYAAGFVDALIVIYLVKRFL